ncbi:hypothetical protein [Methylorubrum extorquens]
MGCGEIEETAGEIAIALAQCVVDLCGNPLFGGDRWQSEFRQLNRVVRGFEQTNGEGSLRKGNGTADDHGNHKGTCRGNPPTC